jgi:hypothetical protein
LSHATIGIDQKFIYREATVGRIALEDANAGSCDSTQSKSGFLHVRMRHEFQSHAKATERQPANTHLHLGLPRGIGCVHDVTPKCSRLPIK